MIQFKQVYKDYYNTRALDDINLQIEDGEIFGIVGESGSGKSTLLRMINALDFPTAGQVMVDGVDPHQLKRQELRGFRKHIGMIFQHVNLLRNRTVAENISLPLQLHHYEHPLTVDDVLDFVGLADKRDVYPSDLSGGQQQRIGIAQALISRPRILLCDEPTSALDARMRDSVVDVLKKAHAEFGMTLVIVTHELEVIQALAQRTCILEEGKVRDIVDITHNTATDTSKSYYERVLEVLAFGS